MILPLRLVVQEVRERKMVLCQDITTPHTQNLLITFNYRPN